MAKLTKKRVIVSVIGLVVVAALFFGSRLVSGFIQYQRIISEIEIRTPNLLQIQDGTYNGFFDAIQVSADVDVTVENHRITKIVINNHHMGRNSAVAAEAVIIDVVDSQSLEVDAVSGATNSSNVILKAVQIALESGQN